MSESKWYQITKEQVDIIREALSACDGDWWISVRWGEDWNPRNKGAGTLLGSNGAHVEEGIEGVEIALYFSPDTTRLGAVHKVLECSEIRGIRIEGDEIYKAKITDLTQLQDCTLLKNLTLYRCSWLVDISPLSSLKQLQTLDLIRCSSLVDISPLSSLHSLQTLDLSGSYRKGTSLVDISPLQNLIQLTSLSLKGCHGITDLSPLVLLSNLNHLSLRECGSLSDISVLAPLSQLRHLDLGYCYEVEDISVLSQFKHLKELHLDEIYWEDTTCFQDLHRLEYLSMNRCQDVIDLSFIQYLSNLKELDIRGCYAIEDISVFEELTNLKTLYIESEEIRDISTLGKCSHLEVLDLSGCTSIEDVSVLEKLTKLTYLDLSLCKSIDDISFLASHTQLNTLYLESLEDLSDISIIGSLSNLEDLSLSQCYSLPDISPLKTLHSLKELHLDECVGINDIFSLSSLVNLEELNLSGILNISSLAGLENASKLRSLDVSHCPNLRDISAIQNNPSLEEVNLSECNELSDNRKWAPLTQLPSLRALKGPFPSYFTTKIVARNAANNQDWTYITQNLSEWIKTAESSATEPNLLAQVGRACAVHPDGYESLAHIISLSTTKDAPEIDELFATSVPLASHEIIGSAIQSAVDQSKQPLPPETLVALHNHLPSNTTLRDNTIVALTRSISQDTAPEWGKKTAQALREHLNDTRYPITSSVHDDGLSVLTNQQFTPIQSHFFGVLCSGHARSTDIDWRNHFHTLLCGLALSQSDTATRNQSLSDISSGLAICGDAEWVQNRLDYLLKAAAEIDPDTSVIYAAVAHAHATGGRWNEAQETVSGIASPTVRDTSLKKLCAMVLESNLPNKMQRAISCTSALSEPIERAQKLYDLGFHDGILADLVAYGRLVGLLTEFPEKQKEVVAHVTKKKPEMVQSEQNVRSTTITYVECLKRLKQSYPTDYMDMIACIKNNDTEQ